MDDKYSVYTAEHGRMVFNDGAEAVEWVYKTCADNIKVYNIWADNKNDNPDISMEIFALAKKVSKPPSNEGDVTKTQNEFESELHKLLKEKNINDLGGDEPATWRLVDWEEKLKEPLKKEVKKLWENGEPTLKQYEDALEKHDGVSLITRSVHKTMFTEAFMEKANYELGEKFPKYKGYKIEAYQWKAYRNRLESKPEAKEPEAKESTHNKQEVNEPEAKESKAKESKVKKALRGLKSALIGTFSRGNKNQKPDISDSRSRSASRANSAKQKSRTV